MIPTYHPAALLRSRSPEWYRDMERKIRWALQTALFELEHGSDPIPHYDPYVPSDTRQINQTIASGCAADTETTGKDLDSELLLISSYSRSADGCEDLVVWHPEAPVEIADGVIWWNALFDLPVLAKHGSNLPAAVADWMVLA